jgi:hypothetical protein
MFSYPVVRIGCDECRESEIDIPVHPPGKGGAGQMVFVPPGYQGWRLSDTRQICPECDAKLEEG